MAVTMPQINITFEQRATTMVTRSERGIAILIVRDDTSKAFTHKQYTDLAALEADKALYTEENYAAISDMLGFTPYESHVFRVDVDGNLTDALGEITRTVKTGWVAIAGQSAEDGTALASWIKAQAVTGRSYKAVVYNVTPLPDHMRIVNFVNPSITFSDNRGKQDGAHYLPSLAAIFAVCNVKRGCTNFHCSNLAAVEEVVDNDAAIGAGKFVLYNDDAGAVRIGQGINSLTTLDGKTRTEDMQFIETVEAMDMICDDIRATFRRDYLGNYRNSRDNQMMLIASINMSYFAQLAKQNILDPDYHNAAEIDVEAQRDAWLSVGKAEAADWDRDKIKATPFKRTVYLTGRIKILGSMTDLFFPINLF